MNPQLTITDTTNQLMAAKRASRKLAKSKREDRDQALELISKQLLESKDSIIAANKKDIEEGTQHGLADALIDRLVLNEQRLTGMTGSIQNIVSQKDPIGRVLASWKLRNGMAIEQVTVPFGVICVIYEARPNVTTDAVSLAIKSGNAIILRGSHHAINSNEAIVNVIREALSKSKLDPDIVQFISKKEREESVRILQATEYVDLVIPRGGNELKKLVEQNSKIPVIGAGGGTCHLFVDDGADEKMALDIAVNAKTQRPGVCNAIETILVHKNIASGIMPKLEQALGEKGVKIHGCDRTRKLMKTATPVPQDDWSKEYLALEVAVKIVDSLEEAVNHINQYGTKHSEAIVTKSTENAKQFQEDVDAACVYVNASTRFTDGEEWGLGS